MTTINRISMINSSKIPSKKSKENTNNSISTNNQNSASLNKSANAHHGRNLVSFKAHMPLTFHQAKNFVQDFNFHADANHHLTGPVKEVLSSDVGKLLHIAKNHESLKEEAQRCLSGLLNHENRTVQEITLHAIGNKIEKHPELASHELVQNDILHKIWNYSQEEVMNYRIANSRIVNSSQVAFETLDKIVKANHGIVTPDLTYDLGTLLKHGLYGGISTENSILTANILGKLAKIKPDMVITPRIVGFHLSYIRALPSSNRAFHYYHTYVRSAAVKNLTEFAKIKPEIITPELFHEIRPHYCDFRTPLPHPDDAFDILTEFAKINPQFVSLIPPKKLMSPLRYAKNPSKAFSFLTACAEADPKLRPLVVKKIESYLNYSSSRLRSHLRSHSPFEGYSDDEVREAALSAYHHLLIPEKITEVKKIAHEDDIIERIPNPSKKGSFLRRTISNHLKKLPDDLLRRVVSFLHSDGPGMYDQASINPYLEPKNRLTKLLSYIPKPKKKAQIKENIA